jgi:hypothetical protein
MMWLCPEEERRRKALPAFFCSDLESIAKRGRIVTTVDQAGVAAAPGQSKTPTLETLRVAAMLTRQFGRRIRAGLGLFTLIEKQHPEAAHWYLDVIGTDPDKQGRGVGGASSVRSPTSAMQPASVHSSNPRSNRTSPSTNDSASR